MKNIYTKEEYIKLLKMGNLFNNKSHHNAKFNKINDVLSIQSDNTYGYLNVEFRLFNEQLNDYVLYKFYLTYNLIDDEVNFIVMYSDFSNINKYTKEYKEYLINELVDEIDNSIDF